MWQKRRDDTVHTHRGGDDDEDGNVPVHSHTSSEVQT